MQAVHNNLIALDYGERRVGVAIASSIARLPHPLTALQQTPEFWQELQALIQQEEVGVVVLGLPRGMQGQDTAQTQTVHAFAAQLKVETGLPVHLQDEALTSQQAEAELRARGKNFDKGMIDSLSAVYILEDFLRGGEAN